MIAQVWFTFRTIHPSSCGNPFDYFIVTSICNIFSSFVSSNCHSSLRLNTIFVANPGAVCFPELFGVYLPFNIDYDDDDTHLYTRRLWPKLVTYSLMSHISFVISRWLGQSADKTHHEKLILFIYLRTGSAPARVNSPRGPEIMWQQQIHRPCSVLGVELTVQDRTGRASCSWGNTPAHDGREQEWERKIYMSLLAEG